MLSRVSAIPLLIAALAMVIETACSQAPAPNTTGEHKDVVTKINTVDGTLYVTSNYVVTESGVVIRELLRDDRYYSNPDQPHVFHKPEAINKPPADITLPLRIPADQVQSIESWNASHTTRNGLLVAAGAVLVAAYFVLRHEFSGYNE
jgi:hypothetical protein